MPRPSKNARENGVAKWTQNAQVAARYGVSAMCIWRWNRDPKMIALGWPADIVINRRRYKETALLDQFDENVRAASMQGLKTSGRKRRVA